jgi:hypothetical protein
LEELNVLETREVTKSEIRNGSRRQIIFTPAALMNFNDNQAGSDSTRTEFGLNKLQIVAIPKEIGP